MSEKRDALIKKYADILRNHGEEPDMDLLEKVVKGMGPGVYNNDSSKIAAKDKKERETVRKNFLGKKLGMEDSDEMEAAMDGVFEKFGRGDKHRAVVYYYLAKHYGKEGVYG